MSFTADIYKEILFDISAGTNQTQPFAMRRTAFNNSCDKIIKNLKFGGFKAQQDYYTIALIGKYYSDLFHPQEIWNSQMISAEMAKTIEELAFFVWNHFQNPTVPGVNVGQWCKKEECWELLQARYENEYMQR